MDRLALDGDSLPRNPTYRQGDSMTHVVLTLLSVALLLAVMAFVKERRLRLALQVILKRLINHWRSHANTEDHQRAGGDHDARSSRM